MMDDVKRSWTTLSVSLILKIGTGSLKVQGPTGGGPCQKRGGLGMSTGIQPGRHEYQLSVLQW